jgi:hypothetical protein
MPLFEGKDITPDEAIALNRCPECAADLTQVNPIGHRNTHWITQPKPGRRGEEGLRRMGLLDKFIADNNVRTSNMSKPSPKADAPETKPADAAA